MKDTMLLWKGGKKIRGKNRYHFIREKLSVNNIPSYTKEPISVAVAELQGFQGEWPLRACCTQQLRNIQLCPVSPGAAAHRACWCPTAGGTDDSVPELFSTWLGRSWWTNSWNGLSCSHTSELQARLHCKAFCCLGCSPATELSKQAASGQCLCCTRELTESGVGGRVSTLFPQHFSQTPWLRRKLWQESTCMIWKQDSVYAIYIVVHRCEIRCVMSVKCGHKGQMHKSIYSQPYTSVCRWPSGLCLSPEKYLGLFKMNHTCQHVLKAS